MRLYRRAAPGHQTRHQPPLWPAGRKLASPARLAGGGAHERGKRKALAVLHTFAGGHAAMEIPLPACDWKIDEQFPNPRAEVIGRKSPLAGLPDFSSSVLLLSREAL